MPTQPHTIEQNPDSLPAFLPEQPIQTETEQSEYAAEAAAFEQYAAKEHLPTSEDDFLDESIEALNQEVKQKPATRPAQVAHVRDPLTIKIEHIMEDGLVDAFREMTPVQQQEFKIKGEQTAHAIHKLLAQPKVKIKTIFELLIDWLKLIPGVNRFFIEQEAKIKTDKLFALRLQDISQ